MEIAHELILLGGALGLLCIIAGRFSARFGAPILLVFLVLGMLAGEDGPGGLEFSDFNAAYLIGSVALVIILFEGGLKTSRAMIRLALWPALALATVGVALTAGIVAAGAAWLVSAPWIDALLIGTAVAPTDAAAVSVLLRRAKIALPERVAAALEVESGLNDPMSVFLTVVLVELLVAPGHATIAGAALLFLREMGLGAAFGIGAGYLLLALFRRLKIEMSAFPVLALAGALALFGGAQRLEASGFLAVYLAAVVVGTHEHRARMAVERFFETFGWLAQIVLFLMLGLLVTPHELVPLLAPTLGVAAVLIVVARPAATFACLLPFGFSLRESAFASWVGLRGAVPIYLTIIPVLAGAHDGVILFGAAFVIVIVSLIVQGWTVGLAGRLLGFGKAIGE
jgi:NhaP-type Na+/H+ and K+/H+ antiporter